MVLEGMRRRRRRRKEGGRERRGALRNKQSKETNLKRELDEIEE